MKSPSSQTPEPLSRIAELEANTFRIGQLARRLRAENPDLPLVRMQGYAFAGLAPADAGLDIRPGDVDAARAWAKQLSIDLVVKFTDPVTSTLSGAEIANGKKVIDGVTVELIGVRTLSPTEWAAHQAAEGGSRDE